MRIVGVQPARDPVPCGAGPVRVGSAQDDEVVLHGAGVAPHHVSIVADARGLVLTVGQGCQRVYVNARAVRERALLRYGDTITLGNSKFMLTTDSAPPRVAESAANDAEAMAFPVLRIVAGAASGQTLAVAPALNLGAGCRHFGDLGYACSLELTESGLAFESESAAPRVNGWRCDRAVLAPNDQIALGEHRLVVEAPGLQHAVRTASLPPPEPVEAAPTNDEASQSEIWWLIGAAFLLAAVIAMFLYFRW
jgi:Inner membrane component of T3SS, cytoplasmic domain